LPLLFIPVIIHLINRLRHRPQPWAAMRFLRAANRSAVSQAKLRQFLVLLFRVLAVLALVFFLSRPLAGGWLGWALSPAPEVVILVLDRSASMEVRSEGSGRTLREQALEMWSDALRPFQRSRLVLVDSASESPQELPGVAALSQPAFTGPSDGRADIPLLLQRAYTYLKDSRSGAAEVWIASDLQESNWAPEDAQWERVMAQFAALPQKVRFRLLTFEPAENASLALVEAVRRTRQDQRSLAVTLDLQQTTATERPVQLRWTLGGASSESTLDLSGQSLRWRNQFPLPGDQAGWGKIELGADANLADNQLFFAFEPERIPHAIVVSSAPRSVAPVQFAASDLSRAPIEMAQLTTPENFLSAPLSNAALIVWQSYTMNATVAPVLEQFVAAGGSLLFLPEAALAGPPFAGISFADVSTARTNTAFSVAKWNDLEGPLAKTEEGFGVPVGSLEVYRRAAISGSAAVLATFSDGSPFLVRKALGKGEVYFCATSADPAWSSLADGAVLVPMLQRMLVSGAKRVNSAVMTDPVELRLQDVSNWEPLEPGRNPKIHAGVYKAEGRFVAVNRPAAENDLARANADHIRRLFSGVTFQMHQETSSGRDRLQGEIWRAFVTLMLIFLLAEGLLILPKGSDRETLGRARPSAAPAPAA
jgi:hypothetical protein